MGVAITSQDLSGAEIPDISDAKLAVNALTKVQCIKEKSYMKFASFSDQRGCFKYGLYIMHVMYVIISGQEKLLN